MITEASRIDLHTHSTCSDGRGSVEQVMNEAKDAGLDVIALTDHDTTAGWPDARKLCDELGLGFIPGIEVTTRARVTQEDGAIAKFTIHMLAFLPDSENPRLKQMLHDSVTSRLVRLQAITDLLSMDYDIDWQAVEEQLDEGQTAGRPAIADAMIQRGIIQKRDDFFEFVRPGTKYYVPNRGVPSPEEAIEIIRGAGGVPIIAHPMARGMGPKPGQPMPLQHFTELIELGLAGFEANHRDVPEHVREWLEKLAFEHDLIITGSSDYHGTGKENRLGENLTAPKMLQRILAQATGAKPNF